MKTPRRGPRRKVPANPHNPSKLSFLEAREQCKGQYYFKYEENLRATGVDIKGNRHVGWDVKVKSPYLFLYDKKDNKRKFFIGYTVDENRNIWVTSIERVTPYSEDRAETERLRKQTTQEIKDFQQRLGGIFPSEFLLSELIRINSPVLKRGLGTLYLLLPKHLTSFPELKEKIYNAIYRPIIDRFFTKQGLIVVDYTIMELNLRKRRVKEVLGLQ